MTESIDNLCFGIRNVTCTVLVTDTVTFLQTGVCTGRLGNRIPVTHGMTCSCENIGFIMTAYATISAFLTVYGTGRMYSIIPVTPSMSCSCDSLGVSMRAIVATSVSLNTCSRTGRLCGYNTVIIIVSESIYSLCITVSTVFVTGNCLITGKCLYTGRFTGCGLGYGLIVLTIGVIRIEGSILTEGTDIIKIISA